MPPDVIGDTFLDATPPIVCIVDIGDADRTTLIDDDDDDNIVGIDVVIAVVVDPDPEPDNDDDDDDIDDSNKLLLLFDNGEFCPTLQSLPPLPTVCDIGIVDIDNVL